MSMTQQGVMITVAGLGLVVIGQAGSAQEACSSAPMQDVPFDCLCAGGDTSGTVWGSDPYTSDSDVCTAATHAGVNGAMGGIVRVVPTGGQDSYPGSSSNGVKTRDWGSYGSSFTFDAVIEDDMAMGAECGPYPVGQAEYSCTCPPFDGTGAVWGSDPYTADSAICLAAIHAGVIGADGGEVWLREVEGQNSYAGSFMNGVETRDWGSYGASFTFQPASPFVLQAENAASDGACTTFPTGAAIHSCTCGPGPYSGSVWGNGPYTSDSDLCTAARHSGVIGEAGGAITVLGMTGLERYSGTSHNGITTRDWSGYGESILFDRN